MRTKYGMPVRIEFFDIATGKHVEGAHWGIGRAATRKDARALGTTALTRPDDTLELGFHLEPPSGYVGWVNRGVRVAIGSRARQLVFHYPLHREQILEVHTTPPSEAADAEETPSFSVAIESHDVERLRVEALSADTFRLHGVPHVPHARIRLRCRQGKFADVVRTRLPGESGDVLHLDLQLEAKANNEDLGADDGPFHDSFARNGAIGIGGGSTVEIPEPKKGLLRIRCLRADGTPCRNTHVCAVGPKWVVATKHGDTSDHYRAYGRTDEYGWISWPALAVGEWTVEYVDWFVVKGSTWVHEGVTTTETLSEPMGGEVAIEVVDRDGRPVPFARVAARHEDRFHAWRPVPDAGGVQRIDPHVSQGGTRTLRRLFPGTYTVSAAGHFMEGKAEARIRDRETTRVRIVLQ